MKKETVFVKIYKSIHQLVMRLKSTRNSKNYYGALYDNIYSLQSNFNTEDTSIYKWTLIPPKENIIKTILLMFSIFFYIPVITYMFFGLIGLMSQTIAFHFSLFTLALMLFGSFAYFITFIKVSGTKVQRMEIYAKLFNVSAVLIGIFAFIISSPDFFIKYDFKGNVNSKWQWFLFLLDNYCKVFLLDTFEIFSLKFSTIKANHLYSRIATYFFNLVLSFGILEGVRKIFVTIFKKSSFYATNMEFYMESIMLVEKKGFKFKREGKFQTDSEVKEDYLESFQALFDPKLNAEIRVRYGFEAFKGWRGSP